MSEDRAFTKAEVDKIVEDRLREVIEQRNAARSELTDVKTEVSAWEKKSSAFKAEAEVAQSIREQLSSLQDSHKQAESKWQQDRVLLSAGIADEDVMDTLRAKFSRAEDPGEFGDWFKAEGSQTPLVQAFLGRNGAAQPAPDLAAEASPSPLEAPPSRSAAPASNNGSKPSPGPAQPYSPGSITNMSREEFAANKADILANMDSPFN